MKKLGPSYGKGNDFLDSVHDKAVMEDRENAAIQLMADDDGFVPKVIVFGGAHNFHDNIIDWNDKNKKKFSLIVITPIKYEEANKKK